MARRMATAMGIRYQPIAYRPALAQAPMPPTRPVVPASAMVQPSAPAKKVSVPVVLTAATLGGAALGVALSFLVIPKITKTKMTTGRTIASGAIGGGLIGAGVTLALKG